ncbi:extracellular solute-binding protein [Herbidospora mongoliensis]|uniref:extracellular solute-binding protein n=1 Tax=Herbidospora mongoliensis TaxID=688067 RepID=UPI00082D3401|nr:extracellular solute-binding protein [Herbidospora mongoliensis]
MTRRRPLAWTPFVIGLVATLAFGPVRSMLDPAPVTDCPGNDKEITVGAGYDDSMDRSQRNAVNEWKGLGYTAKYIEISRVPDETRAEMAANDQDGACPLDVQILDEAHLPEFVASGHASPVELPRPASDFMAKSVAAGQIDGTQYGVPLAADVPLTYSIGQTDDLIARLWGGGNHPEPPGRALSQLKNYEGGMVNIIEAIGPELVKLLSDPGDMPDGAELEKVVGPQLESWRMAVMNGLIDARSLTHSESETLQAFRSAQQSTPTVMRHWPSVFRSLWVDTRFRDRYGKLTFTYRPLPRGGVLGGSVLVISPNARNRAAAENLVAHLTTPETQAKLFACGSFAPVLRTAYEVSTYESRNYKEALGCLLGDSTRPDSLIAEFDDFALTVRRAMDDALLRPQIPYYSRLSETFRTCALTVLTSTTARDRNFYDTFANRLQAAAAGRLPSEEFDCG